MSKQFFGYFSSEEQAINFINILGLRGYKAKQISMFTNHSMASDLKYRVHVNVYSCLSENKSHSLIYRMKHTFRNNSDNLSPREKLESLCIPTTQTLRILDKVATGRVFVIANDLPITNDNPMVDILKTEKVSNQDNDYLLS